MAIIVKPVFKTVMKSPNVWTGKDGVTNVESLLSNAPLQDKIQENLIRSSYTKLVGNGSIVETASATAGVLAGSVLTGNGLSSLGGSLTGLTSGSSLSGLASGALGSLTGAGGLGGLASGALGSLTGVASGALLSITGSISGAPKKISQFKLQSIISSGGLGSLSGVKVAAVAAGGLGGLASGALGSLTGASGIGDLASKATGALGSLTGGGGLGGLASKATGALGSITGGAGIGALAGGASSAINEGAAKLGGLLQNASKFGADTATSWAKGALSGPAATLTGKMNALGKQGEFAINFNDIKLPSIAAGTSPAGAFTGTINRATLDSATAKLVGSDKIKLPSFTVPSLAALGDTSSLMSAAKSALGGVGNLASLGQSALKGLGGAGGLGSLTGGLSGALGGLAGGGSIGGVLNTAKNLASQASSITSRFG